MNAKKEAKLNMYHSVIDLCENNLLVIALVIAFETSYNVFKTTVTAIVSGMNDLEAQTGGFAITKKTAKKNLASMGSGIAGMVSAFAVVSNNQTLQEAMRISFTKINTALDDEVVNICNNIYTTANGLIASLADYGVTAPLLATFSTAINDYATKAPKPKQSRNYKKMVATQVNNLFKTADEILGTQMDKLVVNFLSNGNQEFEGQYRAARVLIEPGTFTTVLKIQVTNQANQQPLVGVKCYRDAAGTFKKSSKKGLVTFKDIEQGGHSFILKHKLFHDLTLNGVMMAYGERKTTSAVMIPLADSPGNNLITLSREGNVAANSVANIDLSGINTTGLTLVSVEVTLGPLTFYAAAAPGDLPGIAHLDRPVGAVAFDIADFVNAVGFGNGKYLLNVQNTGASTAHYKLTFNNLEP